MSSSLNSPSVATSGTKVTKTVVTRRRGACEACKVKKIRCDGNKPCYHCERTSQACIYLNTAKSWRGQASVSDGSELSPVAASTAGDDLTQLINPSLSVAEDVPPHFPSVNCASPAAFRADMSVDFNNEKWMEMIFSNQQSAEAFLSPSSWSFDDVYVSSSDQILSTSSDLVGCRDEMQLMHINSNDLMEDVLRDQILNVNFSTEAITLYLDSRIHKLDSAAEEHLVRKIFQKLISTQDRKLPDLSQTSSVLDYGATTLHKYVSASYRDPYNMGSFLDKSYLDRVVEMSTQQPLSPDTAAGFLWNAILALGCHTLEHKEGERIEEAVSSKSFGYFQASLDMIEKLASSENTLLKLQALLSMAMYSFSLGLRSCTSLLAHAFQCSQALGLNSENAIQNSWPNSKDQLIARKTFWCLYSLEKTHSIRRGTFSIIDDDFIDHLPPDHEWNTSWTRQYAKICSLIIKYLYGQSALRKSAVSRASTIELLCNLLKRWLRSLPPQLHFVNSAKPLISSLGEVERRQGLKVMCQYHEAMLAIHGPWVHIYESSTDPSECELHFKCETACVDSARIVLIIASQATSLDLLFDHAVLRYCSIAVRVIFLAILTGFTDQDGMSCLGLACGIFGKMSMELDVPLSEVLSLSMTAQTLISKRSKSLNAAD